MVKTTEELSTEVRAITSSWEALQPSVRSLQERCKAAANAYQAKKGEDWPGYDKQSETDFRMSVTSLEREVHALAMLQEELIQAGEHKKQYSAMDKSTQSKLTTCKEKLAGYKKEKKILRKLESEALARSDEYQAFSYNNLALQTDQRIQELYEENYPLFGELLSSPAEDPSRLKARLKKTTIPQQIELAKSHLAELNESVKALQSQLEDLVAREPELVSDASAIVSPTKERGSPQVHQSDLYRVTSGGSAKDPLPEPMASPGLADEPSSPRVSVGKKP